MNDPHYPLITWTTDQTSGTVRVDGGASSGTTQTISDTGLIAWEPTAISGRTDPHLWEHLATLINAETGTHGVTVTGYVWRVRRFGVGVVTYETPIPRVEMRITTAAPQSTPPEMSFDVLATAEAFGFSVLDAEAVPRAATPTDQWSWVTDVTPAGLLSFGVVGNVWEPDRRHNATRTWSDYDPDSFVTVAHAVRTAYSVEADNVSRRHRTIEEAQESSLADQAGTSTSDTNGTLEGLLEADMDDDRSFYLWKASDSVSKVRLIWRENPSVSDFAASASLGPRRMNVRLPMREVG